VVIFVQLIVVVLAVVVISIDMVADVEEFVWVQEDSRKSGVIVTCSQMKQAFP